MRYYKAIFYTNNSKHTKWNRKVFFEELNKEALVNVIAYDRYYEELEIDDQCYSKIRLDVLCINPSASKNDALNFVKKTIELMSMKNSTINLSVYETNLNEDYNEGYGFSSRIKHNANLFELNKMINSDEMFFDWIVQAPHSKMELISEAKTTLHSKSLGKEINRIFDKSLKIPVNNENPVHYIIEGNNNSDYRDVVDILVSSLFANNRTLSKHVIKLNLDKSYSCHLHKTDDWFKDEDEFLSSFNENFANAVAGNTLFIEYGSREFENDFDYLSYTSLEKFISCIKPQLNVTSLIFSIPEGKPEVAKRIERALNMPLVRIKLDKNSKKNEDTETEICPTKNLIVRKYPQYLNELQRLIDSQGQQEPDAMKELESLIGLAEVKQQIKDILSRYKMNIICKQNGLPIQDFSMHMAFLGNPGTGKTEVAKLYGKILKQANILDEGRVITVNGAEGFNVVETFKKAKGSILFIDEAYAMSHRIKDTNSCAELIAAMENNRRDTIVILAGYKKAMNELFDSNIGFRSRIGSVLEFRDYNQDELLKIFKLMCSRAQLIIDDKTLSDARDVLWRDGRRIDQGNGRFVRTFFEKCVGNQLVRLAKLSETNHKYTKTELRTLLPCDIENSFADEKSAEDKLNELVGLKGVKKTIMSRTLQMVVQKLRRDANLQSDFLPMHMAFTGNPGTGKTELARLVGEILRDKGVLSVGEFFECHPGEITYPWVIDNLFQDARGSIIFFDEAYIIGTWHPSLTAALIKNIEDYREEVVVIFAGYTKQMDAMFKCNPGFKSRVKNIIEFPDYSKTELIKILKFMAKNNSFVISNDAIPRIAKLIDANKNDENFANGRFMRNIFEEAQINQAKRIVAMKKPANKNELKRLIANDFNIKVSNSDKSKNKIGFISKSA